MKKNDQKKLTKGALDNSCILGENKSFEATEAYKLLRANIMFSFANEADCRVIGVTSSVSGEGKTLTTINTAYSLAQLEKKVLLIEADLRLPSMSKKIGVKTTPGLSNFLVGMNKFSETIQQYSAADGSGTFDIMVSGDIPPNPSELLGSDRMKALIHLLSQRYNYIIIDLPPLTSLSDALVVSKLTDGMLMVVRENYCRKDLLNDAVNQLKFVDARILGFVLNSSTEGNGVYGKKYGGKYYKRYYKKYYRSYKNSDYIRDYSKVQPANMTENKDPDKDSNKDA